MSETGLRVAALAGAIGMVALAVVVRDRLDDDGSGSNGGGGGNDARVVTCPPEIEDACRRGAGDDLEVRIEDALVTRDALTTAALADDVETDLWVVPAPWAEAVSAERERLGMAPLMSEPSDVLARSPVTIVVRVDAVEALASGSCPDGVAWRCLGDVTGRPWVDAGGESNWGSVRVGLADPAEGSGLAVLGAATGGYLDKPDYASNDFDGRLTNWLSGFAASAAEVKVGNPVGRMATGGRGVFAAVGVPEWATASVLTRPDFQVVVPRPIATSDLVVVAVGDDIDPDSAEDFADDDDLLNALAEQGWRVPDHDLADGVDAGLDLPDDDGLPSGPVLRSLLQAWLDLL